MGVGVLVLMVIITFAIAAPLVAPDPLQQNLLASLQTPSWSHIFGTDELGRDVYSRVVYGARISLITGAAAALIAVVVGVPAGLAAGFFGRVTDGVIMRGTDFLLALPAIVLAMCFIAVLGTGSVNAIVAIGIIGIPTVARLTRGGVLATKEQDFVVATRALGATNRHILFRTILPNVSGPIIAQMALIAEGAILLIAGLSFLGLGLPPPQPTWGGMLNTSEPYLSQTWSYAVFPGLALMVTVVCLDTIARGLQKMVQR
jgi:peptide/nickel transport system permease protein